MADCWSQMTHLLPQDIVPLNPFISSDVFMPRILRDYLPYSHSTCVNKALIEGVCESNLKVLCIQLHLVRFLFIIIIVFLVSCFSLS